MLTGRDYKVGDKFVFGEVDNGQAYHVFNTIYKLNGRPLHRQGFESLKKSIFKNKNMIVELSRVLEKYDFAFIELAIEEVRKPKLSSRMKCILPDNKEECLQNLPKFAAKGYGSVYQAFAVKVNGRVFYSKDIVIGREGLFINEYKKLAQKYWSQDQNSTAPTQVMLFAGEAEIVEILDEIRLKKQL